MIDTAKLRELADAATPGPWNVCSITGGHEDVEVGEYGTGRAICQLTHDLNDKFKADAAFMAAAREAVPALLDELDKLREQNEILCDGLVEVSNKHQSYDDVKDSNTSYAIGVVDGHRCAAQSARRALAKCGLLPEPPEVER